MLALKLIGGTLNVMDADGQLFILSLNVKYVILHKIDISNWYPSTHASIVSTALVNLIYLIGTDALVTAGQFVFNNLLRHVEIFGIEIPICFPCLLCEILLEQHPLVLTEHGAFGPVPKTITLS